jgi:pyruvate formate lyase activating enzyme
MSETKACIFNIQKFSIHDGPGIRTVVFFKGCPLRCLWCSNPESQSSKIDIPWVDPSSSIALSTMGQYKTVSEIMSEVIKDIDFYEESGGGVTLSGGEVLLQAEFAIELLQELKNKGIHTACETTGYASFEVFKQFVTNVDLLLFDMKHYDREKHHKSTGVYNDVIIENMKYAALIGKTIISRIPVIPGFNNSLEDATNFSNLLNEIGIKKVNLLPFHQFGQKKYELLGIPYQMENVSQLYPEDLEEFKQIFLKQGLDCSF